MTTCIGLCASWIFLVNVISLAMADTLCVGAAIGNNSVVSFQASANVIKSCYFDNVHFEIQVPKAGAYITGGSVSAGSLMIVTYSPDMILGFNLLSARFMVDARLVVEGVPGLGGGLSISNCSFDVRTPRNGDIVPIDLRAFSGIPAYFTTALVSNTINIAPNAVLESTAMVAAIVFHPDATRRGANAFNSVLSVKDNRITLNTTGIAYGFYFSAEFSQKFTLNFFSNYVTHVADGGGKVTAVFVDFPLEGNNSELIQLTIAYNEVRGIRTFMHVSAQAVYFSATRNYHSYFAESLSNITLHFGAIFSHTVEFQYNTFVTTYDSWVPASTYGNPIISLWIPLIRTSSVFGMLLNDFYASRYNKSPFQFPGATDLYQNASLAFAENYFTTNQLNFNAVSMVSFASAETRATDLGTVYVCSNTWPALFVAATTTLAPLSTTVFSFPTTRPIVAVDTISLLVDGADRPLVISLSGGTCPAPEVTTRRPVPSKGSTQIAFTALLLTTFTAVVSLMSIL